MRTAGRHIGRPLQGEAMLIFILMGLRLFHSCSGRGMPRPYKTKGASHGAPTCLYCYFHEYKYAYPGSGPAGPVREGGMVEGALAHRGVRTARRAPATPKPKAGLVPDLGRLSRGHLRWANVPVQ